MSKNNSGGYGGSNLGGHTTDHGNGKSTTSDNRGDISHHTDKGDSKGDHGWGHGDGGNNNSSPQGSNIPENTSQMNMAYAGIPVALYPVSGVLSISLNWGGVTVAVREAIIGLDAYLGEILTTTVPYAGRFLGIAIGSLWPGQIAPDPKFSYNIKDPLVDKDNPYSVTVLPAELVTSVSVKDIARHTTVPASVLAQAVIDELAKTRPVAITPVKSTPVLVVKALKTDKPNVYTAQIVPGMKPMRIHINASERITRDKSPVMPNRTPSVKQYLSSPDEGRSYHAMLDFGDDHAPVYISVTKLVEPEEAKKLVEKARKEWIADNPDGISKLLTDINTLIKTKEKQLAAKQQTLKNKQAEFDNYLKENNNKTVFQKKMINFTEKERVFKTVVSQLTEDVNCIQKEQDDLAGNKTLNEKILTEIKERELNPLKFAEKELEKSRTLVTESEKKLAVKQQTLKNKQAELDNYLKENNNKTVFQKKMINFTERERVFKVAVSQLTGEVSSIQKELVDAAENKILNEKTLAEIKERVLNPLKFAEKKFAAADIELTKAISLVTEKETLLADKRQALKNKRAEFDNYLKDNNNKTVFQKKMINFTEKERTLKAVNSQLSSETGLLETALADAMESRNKAESRKKTAEHRVKSEQDKKRQGVKDKGHDYHPAPKTEEIKGLGELKGTRKKTPKQGGGGKRDRWIGDKGRKIYEWDSQHGELEGYRASDGQHIGAFDPKEGNQLKPADPKRNIKKYL